jgi:hypothetical protein
MPEFILHSDWREAILDDRSSAPIDEAFGQPYPNCPSLEFIGLSPNKTFDELEAALEDLNKEARKIKERSAYLRDWASQSLIQERPGVTAEMYEEFLEQETFWAQILAQEVKDVRFLLKEYNRRKAAFKAAKAERKRLIQPPPPTPLVRKRKVPESFEDFQRRKGPFIRRVEL